jgi:hypothetical protein
MSQMKTGYVMRCIGATSVIAAGVAIAGNSSCYDDHLLMDACAGATCDTSAACNISSQTINEPVYKTTTPGRRELTSTTQSLCLKSFKILDAEEKCTIDSSCSGTVSSTRKHGGWCPDEPKQ